MDITWNEAWYTHVFLLHSYIILPKFFFVVLVSFLSFLFLGCWCVGSIGYQSWIGHLLEELFWFMCFHEVKLEDKYGSENMITRGDRSLAEWKTSIRWLVFGFLHCINGFGLGTYICYPFLTAVAIVFASGFPQSSFTFWSSYWPLQVVILGHTLLPWDHQTFHRLHYLLT